MGEAFVIKLKPFKSLESLYMTWENYGFDGGTSVNFWPWLYTSVSVGAVLVAVFLLYAMRAGGKKGKEPLEAPPVVEERWAPLRAERSVTADDAKRARYELRTLDLEREILSYAIRRLYEAHAEGKITEEERERIAQRYKSRIAKIKEVISRGESLVALHELETMREDLMKLFSERFDEINEKIEEVRSRTGVEPVIEAPVPPPAPPIKGKRRVTRLPRAPTAPMAPTKTEAEKRIEEIKAEVEKVLERLGQIEVEA